MGRTIAMISALLAPASALASAPATKDHEFFCYCEAQKTPNKVVDLDNNWEILSACRAPKTREQLKQAFPQTTDSQLELLSVWRLLAFENGAFRTTFPILDTKTTSDLRAAMRSLAPAVVQDVRVEMDGLVRSLSRTGRRRNAFSILFAYVMDGLVWQRFIEKGLVSKHALTVEKPFWDGTIWASSPRAFSCGTNSIDSEDVTLMINWSRAARGKMGPLLSDWRSVQSLAEAIGHGGAIPPDVRMIFQSSGIFDDAGVLVVPAVLEREGDALFDATSLLSRKLATSVLKRLPVEEMTKRFGFGSSEEALVIAYHELMWEMLGYLEEKGAVHKPISFANPEKAKLSDAADLVFIVKRK